MSEPPPNPWIRFPELLQDPHPSAEAVEQLRAWYAFLFTLSPDELQQQERDHPPPPGWEEFYRRAALLQDLGNLDPGLVAKLEGAAREHALIEKMWQSTTLK